jgi:hypothetical protein
MTARERLNKGLLPLAYVLGGLGMTALLFCTVLWLLGDNRPGQVDTDALLAATVGSLLFASLLGWGCMQKGLGRMRRKLGWTLGGWFFVGLPMACALLGLAAAKEWAPVEDWGGGSALLVFARGYPPALVFASLVAYVTANSRVGEEGSKKRGIYFTLMVSPYALLMAYLIFQFEAPWLDDHLEETIHSAGEGTVVAQVALAYFCGGGSSGS